MQNTKIWELTLAGRRDACQDGVGVQNTKNILSHMSLFKALDDEQLSEINTATQVIRARNNATVVNHGDAPKGVYVVVYGQVRIFFIRKDGTEKTLAILDQNKCFGLSEMLLGREHLAYVRTMADTMLLHVSSDKVMEIAKANFGFANEIMICVGRQLYTLTRDIESYSLQTAKQRVASYLLRQSEYQACNCVELMASKAMIASRLNLTPETFSRLLHELSSDGFISVSGRHITILDQEKIAALMAV